MKLAAERMLATDRRWLRDRRRRDLPIDHDDRRQGPRRATQMQAFLWATGRGRQS